MMQYLPAIKSARSIGSLPLDQTHGIVLYDQIVPLGIVQYAFILAVFDLETRQPCYFVASEINAMVKQFGGGSHYLGVFEDKGHSNLGSSDTWGDPKQFFPKAIELAANHFGAPVPAYEE
jgi:hypothetical protein